jgi:hypothetical protein
MKFSIFHFIELMVPDGGGRSPASVAGRMVEKVEDLDEQ